ncbi:MAG: hypothetical protein AB7K24_11290 [Gemmataceae bacterium]
MTRRNILRPPRPTVADARQARRRQRLQVDLDRALAALARWQTRLRRAFNAVEKHQRQVARLNKQITAISRNGTAP